MPIPGDQDMGDGGNIQYLDILFFAALAVFLVLRLRSVLGRRTGTEKQQSDPLRRDRPAPEQSGSDRVIELPRRTGYGEPPVTTGSAAQAGLTQIQLADRAFDTEEFLKGARAAFEMIVGAFAAGNKEQLRSLLSDEVYRNFAAAIDARTEKGDTLQTTVVGIKNLAVEEAEMRGTTAQVTVKIVSEQVNVTRNKGGEVVDGDPAHTAEVTDLWTFSRDTRASDPNWALVETRSPN